MQLVGLYRIDPKESTVTKVPLQTVKVDSDAERDEINTMSEVNILITFNN